ncbi:hypothetical protein K4A83_20740 [Spirulina subsalsa FACHB-351]|uniref:Uncharacterized protein n=1 Tax=Spirulina subsalsa FACHB-351 TaxID=234711 RepID=A0ABT3LB11_9CYAN|nr:hypothetical protein [Spirulina subsalsa]MCW6038681.1 hypothetical protein [Spirulina subsalsa FACHB-351]
MSESVASLYESGLERYKSGESPESLIPVFKEICDRAKKNAAAWSSLAWLYLLTNKPNQALKAAQKGVKLDKNAPQARVNLVLAMLDAGQKGVRPHVEVIQQMIGVSSEVRQELAESIEDGLSRKPDWASLQRVKAWLFE